MSASDRERRDMVAASIIADRNRIAEIDKLLAQHRGELNFGPGASRTDNLGGRQPSRHGGEDDEG